MGYYINLPGRNRSYDGCERVKRRKARESLREAVKCKRIHRPDVCEECGLPGIVEGHHENYNQPYNVEWLCDGCHTLRHCGERQIRDPRTDAIDLYNGWIIPQSDEDY